MMCFSGNLFYQFCSTPVVQIERVASTCVITMKEDEAEKIRSPLQMEGTKDVNICQKSLDPCALKDIEIEKKVYSMFFGKKLRFLCRKCNWKDISGWRSSSKIGSSPQP